MQRRDSFRRLLTVLALSLSASLAIAAGTRTWIQSEYGDFEKGHIKDLSIRSDGRLTLAPVSSELFDPSASYLWALAVDSKGTLYAGGGPGAKLYSVSPSGQHKKVAELEALEIHAIAINSKDEVFVGASPDGKVYKIDATGKPQEFYNPKQKYIWAMAFSPAGDLFIATGDEGEVHRVDANGKGSVFYKSDETHARSLAFDAQGNLIVGTDPGGLVIRVSPKGEGFVLYQMSKREVTAVAAAPDGSIYAAASGGQGPVTATPGATPSPANTTDGGGAEPTLRVPLSPSPVAAPPRPAAPGSADVYRIFPDGHPEKVWTSARDTVYAIAFDSERRPILGSGNKGTLYRIDTPTLYTSLLSVDSSQITALVAGRDGVIYAATGNVGKVFRFGPGLVKEGSIESDVLDSGNFSLWGRLKYDGDAHGGKIELRARSGNLDRPGAHWSAWSAPIAASEGARVNSPAARFFQWKATLTGANNASPDLDAVETAYLPRNIAPQITEIDITPANYKFPAPSTSPLVPQLAATINLPAIGKHASASSSSLDLGGSTMNFSKGWLGARWNASDENGDTLLFNVEIRGVQEKQWKPLAEKLHEKRISFDSTAFPDGEYRLRITATDAPSNVAGEALTAQSISDPFTIDNTPPAITNLQAAREGANLRVRWHAADALNVIKNAEYSLDGGEWTVVNPVTKLSDSQALDYDVTVPAGPGEHTIAVRVTDDYDNQAVAKSVVK